MSSASVPPACAANTAPVWRKVVEREVRPPGCLPRLVVVPVERRRGEGPTVRGREQQCVRAWPGVVVQVLLDCGQQLGREVHVARSCRGLGRSDDHLAIDTHRAAANLDHAVPLDTVATDNDVLAAQLDQLTKPELRPRGKEDHRAQALRHRLDEGGQLLEGCGFDPRPAVRHAPTPDGAWVRGDHLDRLVVGGGLHDGLQQAVGVGPVRGRDVLLGIPPPHHGRSDAAEGAGANSGYRNFSSRSR